MKRGRVTAQLSAIQKDPKVFSALKQTISRIGVTKLTEYIQASHTTIYDYLRGKPISAENEQHILDGLKAYNEAMEKAEHNRLAQAKALVS